MLDLINVAEIDENIVRYFREKQEEKLLEMAYMRQYSNLLELYSECRRPKLKRK